MSVLESELEQKCCKIAKLEGWLALKVEKLRGYPDRLFISMSGRVVFVEFKRSDKCLPRKLQTHTHKMLRSRGIECYVVYNETTFLHILDL